MRALVSLSALALCAASHAQTASFRGLGDLPGGIFESWTFEVSADGSVVVGQSETATWSEAFRWTAEGGMIGLGDLPGGIFRSYAFGVSTDGAVVVGRSDTATGGEAFRWTAASGMVRLGDLPGSSRTSSSIDVSADGSVVVGSYASENRSEAFRWTAEGGIVGLGDLPGGYFYSYANGVSADGAVVVGSGSLVLGSEQMGFRWTAEDGMIALGDLPGGASSSSALGVSADGLVIVGRGSTATGYEAFRWTAEGGMIGLGDLPGGGSDSEASDVSADGEIAVGRGRSETGSEALRWTVANSGMQRVADLLIVAGVDMTGWRLEQALAVSADGTTIVGAGINPQGHREAWRAVLPRTPVSAAPSPDAADFALVTAPNPVHDRAMLRFTLPEPGPVRLSLHDVLGREVAVADDDWRVAGPHEATLDVSALPAGVYVARLAAGVRTATQRLTVVR